MELVDQHSGTHHGCSLPAAGVFVWQLVTETKGRTLEEIEADLQGAAKPRKAHRHPRRRTAVMH